MWSPVGARFVHGLNAVDHGEVAIAVPGIAVPTDLKQTFECPASHVDKFVTEIAQVTRLLTIGWRGAEPHVLELLREHIQPGYDLAVCDVGDDDVATITRNLGLVAEQAREDGRDSFTGGLTGLLRSDALEHWLARPSYG